MKNLEVLDEFQKIIKELDENLQCIKEYSGVKCSWVGKNCSEVEVSHLGNFTFQTKTSQEMHIPVSRIIRRSGDDCRLMLSVNASQDYKESNPKNRLYIGYALFQEYDVVLDFDDSRLGLIGYSVDRRLIPLPIEDFPTWVFLLIIVGIIVAVTICLGLYCRHKN